MQMSKNVNNDVSMNPPIGVIKFSFPILVLERFFLMELGRVFLIFCYRYFGPGAKKLFNLMKDKNSSLLR